MTAVDDRPMIDHRITEFFEHFEPPEGCKVEFLRGEIVMMAGPDLVHHAIVQEVQGQISAVGSTPDPGHLRSR